MKQLLTCIRDELLMWPLFLSHLSLFLFALHDEWPLLCCSLCASVLACSTYRCLHASNLPFCHPCPPAVVTVALFSLLLLRKTQHVFSFPRWEAFCRLLPYTLDSVTTSIVLAHLHSYFHSPDSNIMLVDIHTSAFWRSGAPGGTGGPLSHSFSPEQMALAGLDCVNEPPLSLDVA